MLLLTSAGNLFRPQKFGYTALSPDRPNILLSSISTSGSVEFRANPSDAIPKAQIAAETTAGHFSCDASGGVWKWRSVLGSDNDARMQLDSAGLKIFVPANPSSYPSLVLSGSGLTGLPPAYGSTLGLGAGFGSPVSGRLFIGDGSGWKFFISNRTGGNSPTDVVTFIDNGKVGIGTTTPDHMLEVVGNNDSKLKIKGTGNDFIKIDRDSVNAWYIGNVSGGLGFDTATIANNAAKLLIASNGNVGIGTISPDSKLTVVSGTIANISPSDNFSGTRGVDLIYSICAGSYGNPRPSPAIYMTSSIWTGTVAVPKYMALQTQGICSVSQNPYGLALRSTDSSTVAWFDSVGALSVGSYPTAAPLAAGIINAATGFTINGMPAPFIPVGAIVAWLENLTGTPSLPAGFQRCDGSNISDAASPYNGSTTPNLNGAPKFLRGGTSTGTTPAGITGGADSHTHSISPGTGSVSTGGSSISTCPAITGSASTLPAYYQVVWIMRIK